nr:cytochrome b/b6 domain-containing protein [Rhizobium sp. P44RR-XXIV]
MTWHDRTLPHRHPPAAQAFAWRACLSAAARWLQPLCRAHGAHILLYALMILMPLAGYTTSAAGGRDLPWFGLFEWPNLLPLDRPLARAAAEVHEYGAYCLYAVVSLHILAALWHHFFRKDEVLRRML